MNIMEQPISLTTSTPLLRAPRWWWLEYALYRTFGGVRRLWALVALLTALTVVGWVLCEHIL